MHPLLTTCIVPIILMSSLNCAIINRYKIASTQTRRKMRWAGRQSAVTGVSGEILAKFWRVIASVVCCRHEIRMSVVMMTLVTVFVVTNVPRMLGMLHEVSCIPDILDCYDRGCQYHVTSLRCHTNTN